MRRFALLLVVAVAIYGAYVAAQTMKGSIRLGGGSFRVVVPSNCFKAFQGIAFSCTVTTQGGKSPATFSVVSGTFPAGIAPITSSGIVAGTPTGTTQGCQTVQATDARNKLTLPTTICITPATLLSITVTSSSNAVQTSQTAQLDAIGTWSTLSGNTTLDLTTTAVWSCPDGTNVGCGTVNSSGLFTASGSAGPADPTATFNLVSGSITITVSSASPTFGTTSLPAGQINQPYPVNTGQGFTTTCSGGTPPYTFALGTLTLPSGISYSSTGVLSGTPTASGTFSGTLTCTDSALAVGTSGTLSIVVGSLSSDAISPLTPTILVGATKQFNLTCTYSNSPPTPDCTSQVTGGGANIVFVNSAGLSDFSGTGHTTQTTGTFNLTAGNLLVVLCRQGNSAATCNAPTDTAGNTLTAVDAQHCLNNNTSCGRLFYTANATGNSADNVTCNISASAANTICIATQYSGIATSTPLDVHGTNDSGANVTGTMTGASVTTTVANELILMGGWGQFHGKTFAAGPGYTIDGSDSGTYATSAAIERQIVSATGTYQPTMTVNATNETAGLTATFKAAATSTGWSATDLSGGPGVASCNGTGLCLGQNAGTSTIQGCISATCASTVLTVNSPSDTSLNVTPATATVNVGATQQFTAVGVPSGNNVTTSATWASSNTTFATIGVHTGLATCVSAGTVSINATNAGLTDPTPSVLTCATASTQGLLSGCTVTSSNTVNFGVNGCPASLPAGWTSVDVQSFEGALHSNESIGCSTTTITNSISHSGTHALQETISAVPVGNQSPGCGLNVSGPNPTTDIYTSVWTYLGPNAIQNTEGVFMQYNTPGAAQDILMDTQNPLSNPGCTGLAANGFPAANCNTTKMTLWMSPQSNCCGGLNSGFYGLPWNLNVGAWQQEETWIHFSTCTGSVSNNNGFVNFYINGVLQNGSQTGQFHIPANTNPTNINNCVNMGQSGNSIVIPGYYTFGNGNPTSFNKYADDLIVMKK